MQFEKPSVFTLFIMISFASVNAVLFSAALPDIAHFFNLSESKTQQTVTLFLIGYTVGQLIYGPLANRFGRKPALYIGISAQIISSVLCVLSGLIHMYELLCVGRFFLALGSGVGLKMTYTLISECYTPKQASKKISYIILSFAIMPGVSIAVGGLLNAYYDWMSCFYAGIIYGIVLLYLTSKLPETKKILDYHALKFGNLFKGYSSEFKNSKLISGGILIGSATGFFYVFSTLTPFIAISLFGMPSSVYGLANMLPPIGLIMGSLLSARCVDRYELKFMIKLGILISTLGVLSMYLFIGFQSSIFYVLFVPIIIINFGLCFVIANTSSLAMSYVEDKAYGSSVMNFINMATATGVVFLAGLFTVKVYLLAVMYIVLCVLMIAAYQWLSRVRTTSEILISNLNK